MRLQPPMTMMDFFRKSAGMWFIERTVHHFDITSDESGESNLIVSVIESNDPRLLEICDKQGIDPKLSPGGASFNWLSTLDDRSPNPNYEAILIDVPNDETGLSGKILRNKGYVEGMAVICRYWFGQDGILTINTDYEKNQGQERCWFVTDDFRIRVSNVKMMNGVNLVTYCSERRCVAPETLQEMLAKHSSNYPTEVSTVN